MNERPGLPKKIDPLLWAVLSVFGFVLMGIPWILPFLQRQLVLGIPLFFLYVFAVWLALIVLVARLPPER